ncbi:hypothetical protein BKIR_c59_5282 [Candidatus Paraburkholderia kirkii UZHbot1]|uniref:Uncharacterized protein n=1 Tax=Candidatus Paraburkholderia kirkii UZHbot1 TaxID=1055526 RepID=G4MFF0_9BURK|nr:hypothetical protein BKIR_c59_5282 [Candidatus Paraburkholderia kirkii UZHbot1]
MLLLSLAPVASQAFEHARIESLLASVCASDARASRPAQAPGEHHANQDASGHLQACAYCDFIAHAPTPPASSHIVVALSKREAFAADAFIGQPRRALIHAGQPRAPPLV